MKITLLNIFIPIAVVISIWSQSYCHGIFHVVPNNKHSTSNPQEKNASYYLSKGYQVFTKYNLAFKFPVKLTDMSSQTKSNNGLFYGGFLNKNSKSKVVFYQVIINHLPAGYKDLNPSEKKTFEAKLLSEKFPGNKEKVVFMGVDAFVLSYKQNGYSGRSLVFIKYGKTYGFNIMTNDNITSKFNSMTNNIEFFE